MKSCLKDGFKVYLLRKAQTSGRAITPLNDVHGKRGGEKKGDLEDEMYRMWEGKRGGRKQGQKRDVKKTASQERSERRAGRNIKTIQCGGFYTWS